MHISFVHFLCILPTNVDYCIKKRLSSSIPLLNFIGLALMILQKYYLINTQFLTFNIYNGILL